MTVIARRIVATPARSASEAWALMINLLAASEDSVARTELQNIAGIASNLIADEALERAAAVVYGSGPRLRLYCLYGEEAISGDRASESALAFNPTEGDWRMSLPCPAEDLDWVREALKAKSSRVTARDVNDEIQEDGDSDERKTSAGFEVDREAFFKS
jgi:hypothetical protein